MKLFKRISSVIIGLISLIGLGEVSASINHNMDLTFGSTSTFNHLQLESYNYSDEFIDSGGVELAGAGSVNVSSSDNELISVADLLGVSTFSIYENNFKSLFSAGDLINSAIPFSDLAVGVYALEFAGTADEVFGAAYDVTVSAVPLPVAVWLFGAALIGFAAYSARRTV